jgi:hypothetical protein
MNSERKLSAETETEISVSAVFRHFEIEQNFARQKQLFKRKNQCLTQKHFFFTFPWFLG